MAMCSDDVLSISIGRFCVALFSVTQQTRESVSALKPSKTGKIQGDGRKFLDRFKSYFGSQISSQSLNEVHYRLPLPITF